MKQYQIRFINEGCSYLLEHGSSLLSAMIAAGLHVDAPCGGKGSCRKCTIDIRKPGEEAWKQVLACQTCAESDLEIRTANTPDNIQILTDGDSLKSHHYNPMVYALDILVAPCPKGQSISDWNRVKAALETKTGSNNWTCSPEAIKNLGSTLKETQGKLWIVAAQNSILQISADKPHIYMAAFDIGTTTIASYLLDGVSGRVLATAAMLNPQTRFGADVISRANFVIENDSDEPTHILRTAVNDLLGQLCGQAGISRNDVFGISIAGNSCIHHLFLGISPHSLVFSPYTPSISEGLILRAYEYGLDIHPQGKLWMLPVIAGFVGADTIGCLISGNWHERSSNTLLIDIGTNGELVLGNAEHRITCSTAAGPALEGAKIQCGVRGSTGAIDHVWLEGERICWHTIQEGKPTGICGSGLVDLMAVLLESGEMDEMGKLQNSDRFAFGDTGIFVTQRDIREVQLAKAAIAAGIQLLVQKYGIVLSDIEEVHIAGAFGSYMNPDSACRVGLIPFELRNKIHIIGNAAGEGAKLVLLDREMWDVARQLSETTEFLELATLPVFQDVFVDELEFPEVN